MFGLGFQEILLLLLLALLIFGARRLPEVGKALGQSIKEFKKAFQGEDRGSGGTEGHGEKKDQP